MKILSVEQYERECYEERAAIMEFDGGLTREDAEIEAHIESRDRWMNDMQLVIKMTRLAKERKDERQPDKRSPDKRRVQPAPVPGVGHRTR